MDLATQKPVGIGQPAAYRLARVVRGQRRQLQVQIALDLDAAAGGAQPAAR